MEKQVFWRLLQRRAVACAAAFHATADSELNDIRRLGFRQPVCVLPNGVDIPPSQAKSNTARRKLLFLGRVHPKKGVDILLRAWGAVERRFPDWDLLVAGPHEGAYLSDLQALSSRLGLKRVEFCGPLYGERKWQAYRDASAYVLPTHSENFGMTVAEALAAGTPSIVTYGAPWRKLSELGAGWWIEIGVDSLVACLERVLVMSPEDLEKMGQAGRDWMVRDFAWDRIGAHFLATYQWLTDGGTAPAWVRLA